MTSFSRSRRIALPATAGCLVLAMSNVAVADSEATVNGVGIDRTVVDAYYESRFQKPAAQGTADERAQVLSELTDIYLLTTQPRAIEFSRDPRIQAQIELQYRGTLAQVVAADYMAKHPATEEEVQAEYQRQLKSASNEQYKARHILVETQAAANDLIVKLNDGADFAELAREFSIGPSAPTGGDLGWFSASQMVKPFADALTALEDGAYTNSPVQTQFGWHVILREESRVTEPPTLESMRENIEQSIEQTKFQEYIQSLRNANEEAG